MLLLPTSPADAEAWALHWVAAWNRRDLPAVLDLFTDEAVFRSPKAATITGCGTVVGKAALEAYWRAALERIGHLHFGFEQANWDPAARTLLIRYIAELGAQRTLAAEILDLDADGRALCGTAVYGAPADPA